MSHVPNCEKGRLFPRTSEEKIQAHDIAETQAKQASRDIQVQILSCVAADKDWELMYFTPFLQ